MTTLPAWCLRNGTLQWSWGKNGTFPESASGVKWNMDTLETKDARKVMVPSPCRQEISTPEVWLMTKYWSFSPSMIQPPGLTYSYKQLNVSKQLRKDLWIKMWSLYQWLTLEMYFWHYKTSALKKNLKNPHLKYA